MNPAFARLRALNDELLCAPSATEVLERWCTGEHPITARVLPGPSRVLPDLYRDLLAVGICEVRHRQVQLLCGSLVLSEADNWYRPDRLSEEANRALAETDAPFGRVVGPLSFRRIALSSRLLWHPTHGGVSWHVLRHTAVLRDSEDVPFSVVIETYTAELLRQ